MFARQTSNLYFRAQFDYYGMMKEIFIVYLWEHKLLSTNLKTVEGEKIEVIFPGFRNQDAGPDFSNARVKIGTTIWAGNVEVHLNASDWYKHHHHSDPVYDNVILHVVYSSDKDVYRANRQKIPCLEVKGRFDEKLLLKYRSFIESKRWIACENLLGSVQRFTWMSWLDRMIAERLEDKLEATLALLKKTDNDWEETFYYRLLLNFGFKTNDLPFGRLAQILPFNLLLRHADQLLQLEALLFGQAGMLNTPFTDAYPIQLKKEYHFLSTKYDLKPMEASAWRFLRMRPANFPTIRLAQLASIIHENGRIFSGILASNDINDIRKLFSAKASTYWDTHYRFDKPSKPKIKQMGNNAIDLLILNTVVQLIFTYGIYHGNEQYTDRALLLLEALQPENNQITRKFENAGIKAVNALQSQALLHLKSEYCNPKRCLDCRIGNLLINSS